MRKQGIRGGRQMFYTQPLPAILSAMHISGKTVDITSMDNQSAVGHERNSAASVRVWASMSRKERWHVMFEKLNTARLFLETTITRPDLKKSDRGRIANRLGKINAAIAQHTRAFAR